MIDETSAREMTKDNPDFDEYCFQFGQSLANFGEGNWFGRLIGVSEEQDQSGRFKPFEITFLGKKYTENEFREKLSKREIVFTNFELNDDVRYGNLKPEEPNKGSCTATGTAKVSVKVDGENHNIEVEYRHIIRPTYLSFFSEVKPKVNPTIEGGDAGK